MSIDYHGGAIVYVNGKELKRANLSPVDASFETMAERYPSDACIRPDGKQLTPGNDKSPESDSRAFADRFVLRHRRLEMEIPASLLVKGLKANDLLKQRAADSFSLTGRRGWVEKEDCPYALCAEVAGPSSGK